MRHLCPPGYPQPHPYADEQLRESSRMIAESRRLLHETEPLVRAPASAALRPDAPPMPAKDKTDVSFDLRSS